MAAALVSTVVWEWTNDQGEWSTYDPDVSNFIEDNYASRSNFVRLADIDRNLSSLAVDLSRMVQVSQYGMERPIRRELYDSDSAVARGATWQWGGDSSRQRHARYTWHSYSMDIANLLEAEYSQNRYSVVDLDISPINQPYVVNLSLMRQINKTSQFARPVQRLLTGARYRTLAGGNSQSWPQYFGSFFGKGSASNYGSSGSGNAFNSGSSGFGIASSTGSSGFGIASSTGSSGFGIANSSSGSSRFGGASNTGASGFGSASSSGAFGFGGTPQPMTGSSVHGHSNTASAAAGSHSSSGYQFSSPSHLSQSTFAFGGGGSSGNSVDPQSVAGPSSSQQSGARPKRVRALRRNLTPGFSSDLSSASSAQSAPNTDWSFNVNCPTSSGGQGTSADAFSSWRDPSSQSRNSYFGNSVHSQLNPPSVPAGNGAGSSSSGGTGGLIYSAVSDLISADPSDTFTSKASKPGARSSGNNYVNAKRLKVSGVKVSGSQDDLTNVQKLTAKDVLSKFMKEVKSAPAKEDCCICFDSLREASGYGQGNSYAVIQLIKCSHMFHVDCITAMYDSSSKNGSIQCPSCKTIYGTKYGNCPDGIMEYTVIASELAGYTGCSTIEIKYAIFQGVQGSVHPNPGHPYKVRGFPRLGYLPNNQEGHRVLLLLLAAWRRRLTFTIGTSVTTGEPDVVVWNEIHHKTEMTNASGHGYPDPNYLNNVTAELAAHGVTDDSQ